MLEEFGELLGQLFPATDPDVVRKFVEALRRDRPISKELYTATMPEGLCQGDILGPVTFKLLGDDGKWAETKSQGLVLSNSCDIENEDIVTIALCFSYDQFVDDVRHARPRDFPQTVARNLISQLLYLPGVPATGDLVCDLSIVTSVSRRYLQAEIARSAVRRVSAFTQLGYYLFLSKLSIHYLRPEQDVGRPPAHRPTFLDRFREVLRILGFTKVVRLKR